MGASSISLDKLKFGSNELSPSEMHPLHKKRVEQCLAKIFHSHFASPIEDSSFKIKLTLDDPAVYYRGKALLLEQGPELQETLRIVRYYQHTGQLAKPQMAQGVDAHLLKESEKSIQEIRDASIPGTKGQVLAGMRIADDTLALVRNILFVGLGVKDPVVNHLGYYAGTFWTFFALRELDNGRTEYQRSKLIGDIEGGRRAQARVVSGAVVSSASLSFLASRFCVSYGAAAAAFGISSASSALFGVGSLLAMGSSLLGALRCSRFHERLGEYLDNPKLTEVNRLRSALKYLRESITVSSEEKALFEKNIEKDHPDWPPDAKKRLLNQKLRDLTEVKVKYMKRRTSTKSLELVALRVDEILAKLEDPKKMVEGITEASELIYTVQKESRVKKTLYMLGFVASLVSFVAMLILVFMTAGSLPFILYGIAGTIYLLITIYTIAGVFLGHNRTAFKNY